MHKTKEIQEDKNVGIIFSEPDFSKRTILSSHTAVKKEKNNSVEFQRQIMSHQIFSYNRVRGIVKSRIVGDGIQSVL